MSDQPPEALPTTDAPPTDNHERSRPARLQVPTPRLTAELPGILARIKDDAADFVVEELPAYLPSGSGEHLFLWIEKVDLATDQLLRIMQRRLGLKEVDIGVAGIKDRRAISRQFVSIPARAEERVGELNSHDIRVLSAVRHQNKLKTGHLRGNRFTIRLREVQPEAGGSLDQALASVQTILARLQREGVPNYYGDQRFGHDGETVQLGFDLLQGRRTPRDLPPGQRRFLLRLALSSVQSLLFNQVLGERLARGLFGSVEKGDVLQVVASGGIFPCEDPAVDQPRYVAHEVVPTGPMFGPKMRRATQAPGEREATVLAESGLADRDFETYGDLTLGTRRALAVFPGDLSVSVEGQDSLLLSFTLPPGCYATMVLHEFVRGEPAEGRAPEVPGDVPSASC